MGKRSKIVKKSTLGTGKGDWFGKKGFNDHWLADGLIENDRRWSNWQKMRSHKELMQPLHSKL